MDCLKEQRIAAKFCVKLGNSATEIFAMLKTVYGDVVKKCSVVSIGVNLFRVVDSR